MHSEVVNRICTLSTLLNCRFNDGERVEGKAAAVMQFKLVGKVGMGIKVTQIIEEKCGDKAS